MDDLKLFDAEYRFMCLIWEHEPVNSTKLVQLCAESFSWKKSTTYSMLKRLGNRKILQNQNATVTSLIQKQDVMRFESEQLLEKAFDNSLPQFLAAFLKDKKLSKQEAEELKKMIEEAAK